MLNSRFLACAAMLATLAGCGQQGNGGNAPAVAASTANGSGTPRAAVVAATSPLPATAPDPTATAGMTQPLSADQVKVTLQAEGAPQVSADGALTTIRIRIVNNGSTALLPSGPFPVNLGARSLAATGSVANGELARAGIPAIAANSSAEAAIAFPTAEVKGKKVQILLVQENAGWFDSWGMTPLVVGPL